MKGRSWPTVVNFEFEHAMNGISFSDLPTATLAY